MEELESISVLLPCNVKYNNNTSVYKDTINQLNAEMEDYRRMLQTRSIRNIVTFYYFNTLLYYFRNWSYISDMIEVHRKLYHKDEILSEVYSLLIQKSVDLADADFKLLQAKRR
tara:strand:- start:1849 stop:2190 length:342 start_codon:yes stop_codon:yes gene_type:complete